MKIISNDRLFDFITYYARFYYDLSYLFKINQFYYSYYSQEKILNIKKVFYTYISNACKVDHIVHCPKDTQKKYNIKEITGIIPRLIEENVNKIFFFKKKIKSDDIFIFSVVSH